MKDPNFDQLHPFFGWLSPDLIKKTFSHTTQYARLPTGTTLKRTFKSPHPALNVTRRNEPVACDIVYANVPAIDDGSIAAVIFVGTDTQVTDVYGIKTDKHFITTLEDNITHRGAPHKLISDSAQVIVSNKVQDILRTYVSAAGKANHISNTKMLLNDVTRLSSEPLIVSLIVLVPPAIHGYSVYNMCVLYSTTHTMRPSMVFLYSSSMEIPQILAFYYVFISGRRSTTNESTATSPPTPLKMLATLLVFPTIVVMP
jgi:hypothetical protein